MTTRTTRHVYNLVDTVKDTTNRTENEALALTRRIEHIADNFVSINQRLVFVMDAVQELRDLYNDNSQVNEQQETPTPPQERREVWRRPTEITHNRATAIRLTMPLLSQLIVDRFFNGDDAAALSPLTNLALSVDQVLANIQTNHNINVGQVPWGRIPFPIQHESIRELEKASHAFGIGLDECDQSWAAKWLVGYKWGYLYQYIRMRKNTPRAQRASTDEALDLGENNNNSTICSSFTRSHRNRMGS
ncbi:hypothetical protein BDC45DRAFT_541725 [Circinella umbellata]|nr:hypothetical protein BDC45DRAFT_541725 [Circinella umbellata]